MRQLTIDDFIKEEKTDFVITWLDDLGIWHHERVLFSSSPVSYRADLTEWRRKNPNKHFRYIEKLGGAEE